MVESYPNLVVPLDEIGTDPAYATEQTNGDRDRFYDWVERSPYGDQYAAAPAPSMEALLNSRIRPKFWRHADPRDYDQTVMGWRHEALETGQDAEPDPALRRRIYDTTLRGYGNGGHTFSDDLSDADRAALIEYLKTL